MSENQIVKSYEIAKELYGELGIDTEKAMEIADTVPVSMHSWQGDDLLGFEGNTELSGGIQATGNYPGRARTAEELRKDIEIALSCIPGKMKIALHAIHAEKNGRKADRDEYDVSMFENWIQWAQEKKLGLDFNPTFFSHPMMDGDFSLASRDMGKRRFWIEHGKRCREISNEIGKRIGEVCINNFWMPDGYKDVPADTLVLREIMEESLDEIFEKKYDLVNTKDTIESKLFGLGIESYTVVSHEFALLYAITKGKLYTLDAGHFHPTESIAAKFTAILSFMDEIMLHVSRGVRWDSDHVVLWDDELQNIMNEIVHNHYEKRVHIGLDYFDASINRIACWVIGVRNVRKALLKAALDPVETIRKTEVEKNYTKRLALLEETKSLPFSAIWNYYCLKKEVPIGENWLDKIRQYEEDVLLERG